MFQWYGPYWTVTHTDRPSGCSIQPWWNNHDNWWVDREECIELYCSNGMWMDLGWDSEEQCIEEECPEQQERDPWVVLWPCPGECEDGKIICGGMCCPEEECVQEGEDEWCELGP